jgi:site-specific DNA-methyltransferase (adenine-specific)
MHVEMRPIGSIRPYEDNPRLNDAAVDAVAASIRAFGFRQPIVVDEQGVIIVGHTRYKAAVKLGLTEVPVHVAAGLTPEQARAYRIADNQTATLSQWDDGKLTAELVALQGAGFDLDLTGFTADDLTRLLGEGTDAVHGDPDEVPDAPAEPETRPGDVWVLGRHRLICGDATRREDLDRLMGGAAADLLLTDPPYGVNYVGRTKDELTIENDDLADDEAYRRFLATALGLALPHLRPGGAFYLWHADVRGLPVRLACREAGMQVRQVLIWAKQAMVLGRQDYQWRHEPCLYGWRAGGAHAWYGDRAQTTVLEFDRPSRSEAHPTMKPVDLVGSLIRNSSPPGGRVLDPFGGAGSTLIAADQEGRTAYLLELDPAYCDVIKARWAEFTGKAAVREPGHEANGTVTSAHAGSTAEG